MPTRWSRIVVIISLALMTGAITAFVALRIEVHGTTDWHSDASIVVTMLGFGLVGATLVWHRPDNSIGWLLLGFAGVLAVRSAFEEYAIFSVIRDAPTQAKWAALAVNALIGVDSAALVTVAVVFPGGVSPSRRWRVALTLVWTVAAATTSIAPFLGYENEGVVVPAFFPAPWEGWVYLAFLPVYAVLLAAMVRIVRLRFRGAAVERQQIRWVAYVLGVAIVLLVMAPVVRPAADVAGLVIGVGVPIAISVAITRHRLYEIDRVVSRTVSYGVVLAVLAVVFGLVVTIPTAIVDGVDTPSWLVAGSTLLVFALFNPVRRRVQHLVDQRFNRARYDAEQVVGALATRLRDGTDQSAITAEVASLVGSILHPERLSMWIVDAAQ